ncbi:MAG: hypothetical protein QOK36_3469 [Gaiellales bacterium]|jgi:hypothetical protein|nr:hypothetical protein [Gaiellales bacterium]
MRQDGERAGVGGEALLAAGEGACPAPPAGAAVAATWA